MASAYEDAKRIVDSWPEWKRGILEASGSPTVKVPRPVVEERRWVMSDACAWLTYDDNGDEYVFANRDEAEHFVGDSEDAATIHPLVMAAKADGLGIELDLHRARIAELEAQLAAANKHAATKAIEEQNATLYFASLFGVSQKEIDDSETWRELLSIAAMRAKDAKRNDARWKECERLASVDSFYLLSTTRWWQIKSQENLKGSTFADAIDASIAARGDG